MHFVFTITQFLFRIGWMTYLTSTLVDCTAIIHWQVYECIGNYERGITASACTEPKRSQSPHIRKVMASSYLPGTNIRRALSFADRGSASLARAVGIA
jgi:hypothetical protein